jgi:hypothetical protein
MDKMAVDIHNDVYRRCQHRVYAYGEPPRSLGRLSCLEKWLHGFEESPDRVVDWTLGSIIVGSVGLGFILGLLTHVWMVST